MSKKASALSTRSMAGFNIQVAKNSYPRPAPRLYHFSNLKKLLDDSHEILSLSSFGKKVFTLDGKLIKEDSEIEEHQSYLISCGEPFNHGIPKPKKEVKVEVKTRDVKVKTKAEEEEEEEEAKEDKNSTPSRSRSIYDSVSFLFKKEEKKEEEKKEEEKVDEGPKVQLQRSTKTVDEQFRDDSFSKFCQMPREDQMKVPNSLSIRVMIRNTQREHFISNYVEQNIKSELEIEKTVADLLFDRKPLEIHFATVGPPKSGRSSVLYEIAKSLYVKLQSSKILVMMANFEICSDIFSFVIKATIFSLKYCAYQLNPLSDILTNWFLSIPNVESLSLLPAPFFSLGNCDAAEIQKIGRALHAAYHAMAISEDNTEFYTLLAAFPSQIGKTVQLDHVYYIIDHFDLCAPDFAQKLAPFIQKEPYVVSSKNDAALVRLLPKAQLIETENLVKAHDNRILFVRSINLRLDISNCKGCPTYVKAFVDLCNTVDGMKQNATVKSKYSQIKSKVDESRKLIAVEKLKALCESLLAAKYPVVNSKIVNSIDDNTNLDFVITTQGEAQPNDDKSSNHMDSEDYEFIEGAL